MTDWQHTDNDEWADTQAEWIERTERDVRGPHDKNRVSDKAADYDIDQSGIALYLRNARTEISRLIKKMEAGDATVSDMWLVERDARLTISGELNAAIAKRDEAAEQATLQAIERERERRKTPGAWQTYQADRERIEHYLNNPGAKMVKS